MWLRASGGGAGFWGMAVAGSTPPNCLPYLAADSSAPLPYLSLWPACHLVDGSPRNRFTLVPTPFTSESDFRLQERRGVMEPITCCQASFLDYSLPHTLLGAGGCKLQHCPFCC